MPSIINPYIPVPPLPHPRIPHIPLPIMLCTLLWLTFIGVSLLAAFCVSRYAEKKWSKTVTGVYLLLTGIAAVLLLCFFGVSITAIKGIILFLILLYASHSDIQTREVDDYIPVMLAVIAFIGIEISNIGFMLIGAIAISLPQLFMAMMKPEKSIGGADIKLSAACGFLLGIEKGIFGLIAGMLLAVICTMVTQKFRNKKTEAIPLIPYLAVAFITAYFI